MQTIWLSPTDFVTGDPTLQINYPSVAHPGTVVTCNAPGDLKWVSMDLRLAPGLQIVQVDICYQLSNGRSFISQVRLTEMTTPDHATVIHDDPADLTSTAPTTYSSAVAALAPSGAVNLELRLNFQNTSDEILLGAVGIKTEASGVGRCVNSIANLRTVPAGAFRCLQLLGYYGPGDGGGGEFFWDATSSEADNGGTTIQPASNPATGRWKRMVEGELSVKWFGATGNGTADDTDAIQATEDVAAAVGDTVYFPPGTYVVNGAKTTIPGDTRKYGIEKKSNSNWVGNGYASSILRMKNNSTSVGVDPQMIYANAKLVGIGFYHLGFDLNGENNTTEVQANVAAIWFNGELLEIHGMVVEDCKFYHGPGGTVILAQNRATSWDGYPLDDVLIQNNRFEDNCLSPATNDHSTMNIWARRTRAIGNIFQQTSVVPTIQRYGVAAVIEFHGGDGLFVNNVVRSYGSVVIPSENFIEPWENLLIANNLVSDLGVCFTSIEVGTGKDTKPINNIIVRDNDVVFNNVVTNVGYKVGLVQAHGKPISYIEVSDNYFEMATPTAGDWSIGVYSFVTAPGTSYTDHLKVSGNTFNKMEFGVWVDNANMYDQVKNLEFVNNTCLNMQDLSATPEAAGLWADGSTAQPILDLIVTGNRFINEANNAGYKYGVSLNSYHDNLVLFLGAENVFYNIKGQNIWQR
jgi:hypothetical protein